LAEEDVRIVDPQTRRPCRADQIGEIWVSGDHVAQGYWRRPEQTAMTFQAELEGPPARPYLRTGDLGALIDDELFVVGRLKDMVIIRGRNYYPHDIENTAQSAHPSVRPGGCAAFSVPRHDIETLIVVLEINDDSASTSDLDEISFAIRGAITSEHQVTAGDVLLVRPGQLHKTSSGKIMRAAARRRYLNGEFDCAGPRIGRSDPADLTPSEGR
jgi:acyl-CoA synthetase (AMP-forming)/AMP-acid ligase II